MLKRLARGDLISILPYQTFVNTFFELFSNFFENRKTPLHILKKVMIMIKAIGRFFLLLILCVMLVYAPEIFSAVSKPYLITVPERVLLRIALSTGGESSELIHKAINIWQKDHPSIHFRVTQLSTQQLSQLHSPYPDVIVCMQASASQVPSGFIPAEGSGAPLCVFLQERSPLTAAVFASYIIEATAVQSAASEI